jgi:hypothetical protein
MNSTEHAKPTDSRQLSSDRESIMALEKELAFFDANLIDLLDNEGKFVVVRDETIDGPYDTYEEALQAGYDRFGLTPFLVKQIHKVEPIHYFSRDLPACQP